MKIAVALVFVASVCRTLALPGGAPLQACENLTPGHGAIPQPNPSPYILDISSFTNATGLDYNVSMSYPSELATKCIL